MGYLKRLCLATLLVTSQVGCANESRDRATRIASRLPAAEATVSDRLSVTLHPVSHSPVELAEVVVSDNRFEVAISFASVRAFDFVTVHIEELPAGASGFLWYPSSSEVGESRLGPETARDDLEQGSEFDFRLPDDFMHVSGEPAELRFVLQGQVAEATSVTGVSLAGVQTDCGDGQATALVREGIRRPAVVVCAQQRFDWETDLGDLDTGDTALLRLALSPVDLPRQGGPGELIVRATGATLDAAGWEMRIRLAPEDHDVWSAHEIDLPAAAGDLTFLYEAAKGSTIAMAAKLLAPSKKSLPNIVLVSIDTLRADRMSIYGYERPTTPGFERFFGRGGLLFERMIASSPWTLPSHTTLFTGVSPLRHGVNYDRPLGPAATTLAERMAAAGYHTLAYTGGGYLNPRFGLSQGFDEYVTWAASHDSELEALTEAALKRLDTLEEPFFLFFHTYRVHVPYRPFQPHYERLFGRAPEVPDLQFYTQPSPGHGQHQLAKVLIRQRPGQDDEIVDPESEPETFTQAGRFYDSGVASADEKVSELLAAVEERFDEPLVALVTSDHGEALGESGRAGHAYLDESNLHIPLLIYDSRREDNELRRIAQQVSLEDVTSTVLAFAGEPLEGTEGRDLTGLLTSADAQLPHRSVVSYAASSNYGVSLTGGGRIRYVFVNTPWFRPEMRHEWMDLRSGQAIESNPDGNMQRIQQALFYKLHSEHSGLHVQIHSASVPMTATLRSPSIGALTIKIADPSCPSMTAMQGALIMQLPAEASCELIFANYGGESLKYELTSECGSASGRLETPSTPIRVPALCDREDQDGSREGDAGMPPAPLLAWYLHSAIGRPSDPPALPDELEQQLRALGYVP